MSKAAHQRAAGMLIFVGALAFHGPAFGADLQRSFSSPVDLEKLRREKIVTISELIDHTEITYKLDDRAGAAFRKVVEDRWEDGSGLTIVLGGDRSIRIVEGGPYWGYRIGKHADIFLVDDLRGVGSETDKYKDLPYAYTWFHESGGQVVSRECSFDALKLKHRSARRWAFRSVNHEIENPFLKWISGYLAVNGADEKADRCRPGKPS